MSDVIERFLRYVSFETTSKPESSTYPSTASQLELLKVLVEELKSIGLEAVKMDEWGYVTATLPANTNKDVPVFGLLAHVDTSPAASGKDIKARIVQDYPGGEIQLNPEKGIMLSPSDFPSLNAYIGQDLIVTDGTTLLGADDKAGVAAIVSAMKYLMEHSEIEHGTLRVGFTPDEEVGGGVDHFDVPAFGAQFAFTVDGGPIGELEYENFNAAGAKVTVHGRSVHPGTAKNQMKNAALIAMEFNALLPVEQRPEYTEGYEGFIHLTDMQGHCEEARLGYIIRDHDKTKFEAKKREIQMAADFINARYGTNTIEFKIRDSYFNMKEMILPHPQILDYARQAYRELGLEPVEIPVRGGTDGSRLSYMGLPTPNLFSGGHNFHGRFEYIPVQSLEKTTEMLVKLVEIIGKA
ncbi:MAG TPA: peptidase T [Anaerolineaceae bacterium]|nr:peptidase T [Anaerolineaceae bacterium]